MFIIKLKNCLARKKRNKPFTKSVKICCIYSFNLFNLLNIFYNLSKKNKNKERLNRCTYMQENKKCKNMFTKNNNLFRNEVKVKVYIIINNK